MVRKGALFVASVVTTALCGYLIFGVGFEDPADEARVWAGLFFFGSTIPVCTYRMFDKSDDGEDEILRGMAMAGSKGGRLIALLSGLGVLAACGVAAFHPTSQDVLIGWIGLLGIGGFGIWGVAMRLARTGPHVTITDKGIEDRTNGVGRIPWSAIAGFERKSIHRHQFLVLRLYHPETWLAKRSAWTRWTHHMVEQQFGIDGVPIRISGLPVPEEDVVAEVTRSIDEARTFGGAP